MSVTSQLRGILGWNLMWLRDLHSSVVELQCILPHSVALTACSAYPFKDRNATSLLCYWVWKKGTQI